MDNKKYNTHEVKCICESKLKITFKGNKELNGYFMIDGKKAARITVAKGRKDIPPKTISIDSFIPNVISTKPKNSKVRHNNDGANNESENIPNFYISLSGFHSAITLFVIIITSTGNFA